MVPSDGSHAAHSTADKSITIEEIIFSCDVCQAVVSDIYATKDSNHGFSSGDRDENGTVTRLWMGACTHIFCSKHLEGGAVPFHSKDSGPRAPCPVCAVSNDFNARELFAIRGVNPGEYDGVIPSDWLVCPPIKLDAEGPGMDALRFQYNRFVRYSTRVREIFKSAESKQRTMEAALAKERKQWRKRETSLQKELEECKVALEDATNRLEKWNQRKDGIEHYMGIVVDMAKDLTAMRSQLLDLGIDYPLKQYAFDPPQDPARGAQQIRADHGGSYDSNVTTGRQKSSSSHKRKISDYDPYADGRVGSVNTTSHSGIGRMPPSQSGGTQFEHGTHRTSQRRSGLASQSTRPTQDRYPRPPPQSVALPSQTPVVLPWEDLQQRRAPRTKAQDLRQPESYSAPLDGSYRQYLAGYSAVSPQVSQRDLISRIGHTRLDSEARRSIPSDGARMPFKDNHQVLREDVQYAGSREPQRKEHDIYHEDDPAARILETNLTSGTRRSRINHFDAPHGTVAQQSGMHAPCDMEPVPPSTGSRLRTNATQEPGFTYQPNSPARRRIADTPAASVISPFFKAHAKSSQNAKPSVPEFENDWRHPPAASSRRDHLRSHRSDVARGSMGPPPLSTLSSSAPRRNDHHYDRPSSSHFMPPPSQSRRQLDGRAYAPVDRIPLSQSTHQSQYSQSGHLSNTPFRPPSQSPRSRVSLPPSRSMATIGSRPDPELSRISGVRGAGVPQYDSRSLFSAAGSRRSVRR